MLASNKKIEVKDMGAGSKKQNSKFRKLNKTYKWASNKGKYAELLYKISSYYQAQNILELGTSLGFGTMMLRTEKADKQVLSIEACANTLSEATKNFEELVLTNICTLNMTFEEYFKEKPKTVYDVIFVDGHHDGEALLAYMENLKKQSHDETIFIIDDIRWSQGMWEAWQNLIQSQEFHVTIDLFKMGLLLKRQHQQKEHFTIRM